MPVKIDSFGDGFSTEYVKILITSNLDDRRLASMAIRHTELADLYLALTDYYADHKEN